MFYKIIFYVCLLLPFCVLGQGIDKNPDQIDVINNIIIRDFKKAKLILDTKFINSSDDHKKVVGYIHLSTIYGIIGKNREMVDALERANQITKKTNKLEDKAYINYGYAVLYFKMDKWDLAIKYYNKALADFKRLPDENILIVVLLFTKNSNQVRNPLYKDNAIDFEERLQYALKSKNAGMIASAYIDMGWYYGRQYENNKSKKDQDLALSFNRKSIPYIEKIENVDFRNYLYAMATLNYANTLQTLNRNKESIASFEEALTLTEKETTWKYLCLPLIYNGLGCNYEKLNNWRLAEQYYLKALNSIPDNLTMFGQLKIINTQNVANTYTKMADFPKALDYQKKVTELVKEHAENQKKRSIETSEALYDTRAKSLRIEQLEKDGKKTQILNWLYIGIMIFGTIGFVSLIALFRNRIKLQNKDKEILERKNNETQLTLKFETEEKNRLKLEQENLLLQQENLRKDAMADKVRLESKDKYLNEIKEQIKEAPAVIQKLLKEEKAVDDEIVDIQSQINKIHPNFFKYLKNVSNGKLSTLDLRYITYIYLDISNYQMSKLLNVDINTVRVNKYRLKQKIGLGKDADLKSFIQNIDNKI